MDDLDEEMRKLAIKETVANIIFWAIIIFVFLFLTGSLHAQTKEEVYAELLKQEVKHPEVVLAQARLETGNMSSNIYKANRNLFGMKLAKQRKTTAKGERYGHAYYKTWKQSIADYKLWQDKYYKSGDYYNFLESYGYATSNTYISKLKQF